MLLCITILGQHNGKSIQRGVKSHVGAVRRAIKHIRTSRNSLHWAKQCVLAIKPGENPSL